MRPLSKLLRNLLIVIGFIFIFDRALGKLIEHYLFTEKQGDSSITAHAVMRTKEDFIIFGSSRAGHHYIPESFKKETGLSCYNVGRDGMKMLYYETLLKSILSYHTPKAVILDLNLNDFEGQVGEKDKVISVLLPYFSKNEELQAQIRNKNELEYWKAKISVLYRVNSLPISIIQHHLGIGQKNFNGYEPLSGNKKIVSKVEFLNNTTYKESPEQLKAFESFVKVLSDKKVKLFVVVSPTMKISKFNAIQTANKILAKYGLRCYDYSTLYGIKDRNLFYDNIHLNKTGSEKFTTLLINDHFKKN